MIPPETTSKEPQEMSAADEQSQQVEAAPDLSAMGERRQGHGIKVRDLHAYYGAIHAIKGIDIDFPANEVTAIIGPSGCGKSTMVRCINRMHEEIPGARSEGSVTLDELDVYGAGVDVTAVRRMIGMVFQKPNPFPTMSIFDNVAAGPAAHRHQVGQPARARPPRAARRGPVGRGQEPARTPPASACPAVSSSACASPARWPSSPR